MVEQVKALGLATYVVPAGRLRQPHRFVSAIFKIVEIVRGEKLDVLLGWMAKAHLYGSFAAILGGIPSMWYQHGVPTKDGIEDILATLLPTRGVLGCSKTAIAAQESLWPKRPCQVVYPCVDLSNFNPDRLPSPQELKQQLGLSDSKTTIGIVGRLQKWKGMHVLVEAMPQILSSHPEVHCVIVGGEHSLELDYLESLKQTIDRLNLTQHITITGFQTNVPEWMQAMDIVVHASDNEPFGLVVIEAMALGKPVIATSSGGPTEIITPELNGLLSPFGDAAALAVAVDRYLDDREFAQRLGKAARLRAQTFSAQNYVKNCITAIDVAIDTVVSDRISDQANS